MYLKVFIVKKSYNYTSIKHPTVSTDSYYGTNSKITTNDTKKKKTT